MRVKKLSITNVLGIAHLDIEPGNVTEILGANETGKTSIIEALKAGLSGGHDATLLRQGATEGQIVLVLEDGVEITKDISAGESAVTVRHPQFGKISKTAAYLKKLVDALSLNPIQFLTAPKKDRVDQLLQAIPMQVTADQLRDVPLIALNGINLEEHALTVIGKIARTIYDLRTGVNRAEKEKRATANQMAETLPAESQNGNWGDELQRTTTEFRELQRSTQAAIAETKQTHGGVADKAKATFLDRKRGILEEADREIDVIRTNSQSEIRISEEQRDEILARVEREKEQALAALEADYRPKHAELNERMGQAKAMVEQHAKAASTRGFIAQLGAESDKLEAEAAKLTHALGRLEILKASLLEKLPIEGLEVRDGDIFVAGLPFDRVNESRRIRLAIEIAKLRAGSLGLVAVDGLERLDPKTFAAFKKEAAKSTLQFVISRVTADEQLSISTEGVA